MDMDSELERIDLIIRAHGMRQRLTLKPMPGDGECLGADRIGSIFLDKRDMERALGLGRPQGTRKWELGDRPRLVSGLGPDFPFNYELETLEPVGRGDNPLAWGTNAICIHCIGCGWECIQLMPR